MTMDETVKAGEDLDADLSAQTRAPSFWESCTADQLREILGRGLAAGDAFAAAAAEIERRASETARRAREVPTENERHVRMLRLARLGVLAAAAIGAALALYRFV
jgi:hypothetical protein